MSSTDRRSILGAAVAAVFGLIRMPFSKTGEVVGTMPMPPVFKAIPQMVTTRRLKVVDRVFFVEETCELQVRYVELSFKDGLLVDVLQSPLCPTREDKFYGWTKFSEALPEDGQLIQFITKGGGDAIWLGTFYRGDDQHCASVITEENGNELFLDGDDVPQPIYWMRLPPMPPGVELVGDPEYLMLENGAYQEAPGSAKPKKL